MYEESCPPGFYCPRGMSYPLPCPIGYYCDPSLLNGTGVIKPVICPKGYQEILGSLRQTLNDSCQTCKPGYFNDDPSTYPCRKCKAGVICFEGATTDEPLGNNSVHGLEYTKSFPCPVGYYCESGDTIPRACPNATFNPDERGSRRENCLPCGVDHYNHLTGQAACFHCGGQARQPYLGQDKCQCNGLHRVFMPSDRTCLCEKGFRAMEGRELDCVRKLYPICKEGFWRNQKGDCLDSTEWSEYCTQQVCGVGKYVGFDRQLGLCTCIVDDLEEVCDKQCRRQQENRLELVCSSTPYLRINADLRSPTIFSDLESFSNIPNFLNTFSKDQCQRLDSTAHPFNLVEMGENGFLGTYDPPADFLIDTLNQNKNDGNATSSFPTPSVRTRRSLLAISSRNNSLSGIANPTTCLNYGSSMLFIVDNDNYPEYDETNLYNTNPDFDSGPFRDLKERHSLMNTNSTLFAFKFDSPGVYVFKSSKYPDYKMYIRVMARGAQCAEDGPFFSTTPRAVIQNGMAISQDILIVPDWLLIGMMMASLVLLMIVLIIGLLIFRKHGWRKIVYTSPKYRKLNRRYNFDDYSSKGSAVHPSKKLHRNFYAIDGAPAAATIEKSEAGAERDVKSDEFWDYEKQVDLEAFSSNEFYSILSKQSRDVTSSIARQKDQAKELYQKVSQQTESLRGLWVAKLNLRGRSAIASPEDLQLYEYKRKELDDEVERRKEIGFTFRQILRKELEILNEDEKERETHQICFTATMVEAMRILNGHTENASFSPHDAIRQRVGGKINALLQKMTVEVTSECQRRGAWALLGQMTGAQLCTQEGDVLHYHHIFDAEGRLLSDAFVEQDPHTGLFVPKEGAVNMMLADKFTVVPIPPYFFVHPKTAKVMPVEGNVVYDSVSSRLLVTADNANDDAGNLNEAPIPYIPYPINPDTGKPVKTYFTQPTKLSDIKFGGPTNDPRTGLYAPILGVTIHPESGAVYPVGGCQDSPVTGLPTAIELGSMMYDLKTDQPAPIVAVSIDPRTGHVIPVGGNTTESGKGEEVPIIMGETFVEPLSAQNLKVNGARLIDDGHEKELEAMGGGYLSALDVCELYHESRVIDALHDWKDAATGPESLSGRHEKSVLETRLKELARSKVKVKTQLLRWLHGLLKREELATILMESGGCPGMYEYYATGQLLPILVGTTMRDVSGSGLDVPILGIDKDPESRENIPLGGSLEDPHGSGLVPIMLGEKAVDPVTNEMSTICGVKLNKDLNITEPVTLSSSSRKKRKAHPSLATMLEEEFVARRSFWRRQRHREREVSENEVSLKKLVLENHDITLNHVSERLELINDGISSLSDAEHREAQRRGDSNIEHTSSLPPFVVHWITKLDQPEREREESHQGAHNKFVATIERFFAKLQAEDTKYRARMDELEGALNPDAEATVTERYHQLKERLRSELEDQLQSRTEHMDEEHAALEYIREKEELLLSEAKLILSGEGSYTGDYSTLMAGVYGDDLHLSEANSELIPLLKRLITLLQDSGAMVSSAGTQGHYPSVTLVKDAEHSTAIVGSKQVQKGVPVSRVQSKVKRASSDPKAVFYEKQQSATFVPSPASPLQEPKASISADQILANLQVAHLGETFSGGDVSVSEIAASGEWTEEKQKELSKNLREKHTLECVQHENELRASEVKAIKEVLDEYQEKKNGSIKELRKELREQLRTATTDEEQETIFDEYSRKMEETVQELENEKQEKLKEVRKHLKRERLRKKRELYNRHKEEARRAGVEHVVDLDLPSDDQLEQDLIQLAQEQEKLIAELQQAYAEEDAEWRSNFETERKARFDAEMEALAKAMSSSASPAEIDSAREKIKEVSAKATFRKQDLKDKMRTKRDKRRALSGKRVPLTTEEQEALKNVQEGSDLEASILEAAELRKSSNENSTNDAIYLVLAEVEEEELRESKKKIVHNLLNKTEMSEEEKRSFVTKFLEEADAANEKFNSMRDYNQAVLAAKLAARKRMKENLAKEKAMKDEVAALSKKQAQISKEQDAIQILERTDELMKENASSEMKSLEEQQTRRLEELAVDSVNSILDMENEFNNTRNSGITYIEEQMEQQKEKMISAENKRFEEDLKRKRDQLSEEQINQLMTEHSEHLELLKRSINIEKERQLNSLSDKIAERRKMKAAMLARKHEAEVTKELVKQQEERNKLEENHIVDSRKKVLAEKVDGMEADRVENTIFRVLQQHHIQQKIQLEEQFRTEMRAAKDEAQAEVAESRQQEKDALIAEQEKEFIELMSNPEQLTANQMAQKKAELKIRHKKQIDNFDKETQEKLVEAKNDVTPSLEVKHAHERLQLRERQLQELAGTMTDLMTKEELTQSYIEEAERAAENVREFRERTTFAMAEKINKIKEERRKQSEEQRAQMDKELRKLELELEEERERETLRLAEREAERECRKRREMEEKEAKRNLEISQRGLAENEKQRLLQEHQSNMEKIQGNLRKEQERTKAALKEKLEARKRKRKESGMDYSEAAAEGEIKMSDSFQKRPGVNHSQRVGPVTTTSLPPTNISYHERPGANSEGMSRHTSTADTNPVVTVGLPENMSENDWLSLLISSPVFERVNEIEELLNKGLPVGGKDVLGASRGRPYIDLKDAQWLCTGDLIPVDINDLSPANFVVYRFGVFITQLLENKMNVPPITLLLASNLPPNNYEKNAFRNSFFFENSRQILFVREERLHSVGDFVVVIMHCLAHILVDEMSDDHNPLFLRAFYKAMRICCQDMFFARARSTTTANTLIEGGSNGKTPLEKAFQHVLTMAQRNNVVSELVDIKVTSVTDIDYSLEAVRERVLSQNAYMDKTKLRGYLATLHNPSKSTKEFAVTRLQQIAKQRKSNPTTNLQKTHAKPRSDFKTPKDLLLAQINELQRHLDRKNAELAQLFDKESQLKAATDREENRYSKRNEEQDMIKQQLDGFVMKRELLVKKIAFIEEDILRKRKEAGVL